MEFVKNKRFLIFAALCLVMGTLSLFAIKYLMSQGDVSRKPEANNEMYYDVFEALVYYGLIEGVWIETKEDYQKLTVTLLKQKSINVDKAMVWDTELFYWSKLPPWFEGQGGKTRTVLTESGQSVEVTFPESKTYFVYVPRTDIGFLGWLTSFSITPHTVPKYDWRPVLIIVVPMLLFMAILIWLFFWGPLRSLGRLGKDFTKHSGITEKRLKRNYTFADVAGVDEAKEEVEEVVSFVKTPELFQVVGARMPHGILLHGPPGTGKSLLAKAASYEAGVPYEEASGSEFHELYIGVGPGRFRDLLKKVMKKAPATLILDEVDSAAPKRFFGGFHQEESSLTNQILHGLDFLEKEGVPVILFAITNRPDMLDPAFLRPGRLDRHIEVSLPDENGRKEILGVHVERGGPGKRPIDPDIDLALLAKETPGFSGADLAMLVNEAAIRASRRIPRLGKNETIHIIYEDFEEAILRVLMGPRKNPKRREVEKEILVWHEAGHAVAALKLPETDELHFVTTLGRGHVHGFTRLVPVEEVYIHTETQLFNQMKIFLAGQAAEVVHFKRKSTGAGSDLEVVQSIARNAVCLWGMSELGPIHVPKGSGSYWGSPVWQGKLGELAELETKRIILREYDATVQLLRENEKGLTALVDELREKPFIRGDRVKYIIENA